jgi:hypothetical protein
MKPEEKPDSVKDKATKEKDAETVEKKQHAGDDVPEPPTCDPALGDLTPAYIEWVRKYHKDDFEARYEGRIPEDVLKHKQKVE